MARTKGAKPPARPEERKAGAQMVLKEIVTTVANQATAPGGAQKPKAEVEER